MNHTLELSETSIARLETELQQIHRAKAEITEQSNILGRQKVALSEELLVARKDLERTSDTVVRVAQEKEDLTKEKAALIVQLTASERECR